MFRRLVRAVRTAKLVTDADKAASEKRWPDAMRALEAAYAVLECEVPSKTIVIELNLRLCLVAIAIENGVRALDAALTAVEQLQAGRERYSPEDRAYLLAFAKAVTNYCLRWRDGDNARELPNPVYDISFDRVSRRVRERFILPPDGSYLDPPPRGDAPLH